MEKDIQILKEILQNKKNYLNQEYILNPLPKTTGLVKKIIERKKIEIEALENCIQRLEDLYE